MLIRLIILIAFAILAVYTYRHLASSRWFHRLVNGITHPEPLSDDEVVERLEQTRLTAEQQVDKIEEEILRRATSAKRIRKSTRLVDPAVEEPAPKRRKPRGS